MQRSTRSVAGAQIQDFEFSTFQRTGARASAVSRDPISGRRTLSLAPIERSHSLELHGQKVRHGKHFRFDTCERVADGPADSAGGRREWTVILAALCGEAVGAVSDGAGRASGIGTG